MPPTPWSLISAVRSGGPDAAGAFATLVNRYYALVRAGWAGPKTLKTSHTNS